jgi:hypothetical protein
MYSRSGHWWQYGACASHARYLRLQIHTLRICRVTLKCDGTRWRTEGEVNGKLATGLGSQYFHTTSEHGVSRVTTADAHTSAASSGLTWRSRWFKWTRPFRRKKKSGFCACAITFQRQSNTYCFSTKSVVARTLLIVTLFTICLSCWRNRVWHY